MKTSQINIVKYIDLRSDTVTQPTFEMRQAMSNAIVGDMQYDEDVTLNQLEREAAIIIGKEGALFVPTGVMGNQICLMYHANKMPRGSEVICADESHIIQYEAGASSCIAGLQSRPIKTGDGVLTKEMVEKQIRINPRSFEPKTALIEIENGTSSGTVTPIENMKQIYELGFKLNNQSKYQKQNKAQIHKIPIHLDGARIFNAAMYLRVSVHEIAQYCDTVMFCVSKGLGAPIGSIIAGSALFIEQAKIIRKQMGGAMRQVGILAAGCLYSLKHILPQIEKDHQILQYLTVELSKIQEIQVYRDKLMINMIFFKISNLAQDKYPDLRNFLLERLIKISLPFDQSQPFRVIIHHEIREAQVDIFISYLKEFLSNNIKIQ